MAQRILIVDDERSVLDLTTAVLRIQGYDPVPAASPREALEIVRSAKPPIDLVLSDVVMPEMQGPELAREISRLAPAVGVVFMSGFAAPEGLPESADLLLKPFTVSQLADKMRRALSRASD